MQMAGKCVWKLADASLREGRSSEGCLTVAGRQDFCATLHDVEEIWRDQNSSVDSGGCQIFTSRATSGATMTGLFFIPKYVAQIFIVVDLG